MDAITLGKFTALRLIVARLLIDHVQASGDPVRALAEFEADCLADADSLPETGPAKMDTLESINHFFSQFSVADNTPR